MQPTVALASFFFALIAAQTTEVPLFLVGFDQQPLVASIIASDSTATTYVVNCAAGTSSDDCGVPGDFTVTEGPSTVAYTLDMDPATITLGCDLTGTTAAACTATQNGVSVASDSILTTTLQSSEISFIPVTIVASGAAVATIPASATATGSSTSSDTIAASPSVTASSTRPTTISSSTSASTSVASTNKVSSLVTALQSGTKGTSIATTSGTPTPSTAGMPRVTGKAVYVLGGAAAAAGLVLGGL